MFRRLSRSFDRMFCPPFEGLWVATWLYFIWCFLVHPQSQILRGNLPDPDDYTYLNQVLDWLGGQSWFDNVQHRLDPPFGVPIHFSRLTQLPMAGLILLIEQLGLGPIGAATLMAVFYPLILLAGMFLAVIWAVRIFVPEEWAGASAFVMLFALPLMVLFSPGHIDHHGLVELLNVLALGCALRMMKEPNEIRWPLGVGVFLALDLVVALECLPWVIIISSWLGLWAIVKGGKAAQGGFIYSLTLHLLSLVFLAMTRPVSHWLTPDILAYSIVYVLFTGGIAVGFAGIALTAQSRWIWRGLAGIGLAAVTGALFLSKFPALIGGPYGAMNPELAKLMLDNINEAIPMFKFLPVPLSITHLVSATLAIGASLLFWRAAPRERWLWGLILTLLVAAALLAGFYQYRFIRGVATFAILPLTVLLQRGIAWIGVHWTSRRKVLAEIALLMLIGPLPGVLLPALIDGRSFNTGVLLFPLNGNSSGLCDMYGLQQILNDPEGLGDRPRVILDTIGIGPEILFRTRHAVLSAPYHTDVAGNLDTARFFSATDPAEAEKIARKRHVELIVSCRLVPRMYFDNLPSNLATGSAGKTGIAKGSNFIEMLMSGRAPDWLKRVSVPGRKNYVVYEVLAPAPDAHPQNPK